MGEANAGKGKQHYDTFKINKKHTGGEGGRQPFRNGFDAEEGRNKQRHRQTTP